MADDKLEILGLWRVKFQKWTWEYAFTSDGVVRWKDPANNQHGAGRWSLTQKTVYISWKNSQTTETWTRPVKGEGQSGHISASYAKGPFQAQKITSLELPKVSGSSELIEFEFDPTTGLYVHSSRPKDHSRYIDKLVTAVGYGIYLGGYHVYIAGSKLPILVPEHMVDFSLASAVESSEQIFESRELALKAAGGGDAGQRRIAYFWGAGGAVVCPTLIGPATAPQLYSTIVAAKRQLGNAVQEELVMLAISLLGGMIARTVLTRLTSVKRGGNEPPQRIPPGKIKPQNGQVSVGGGFENKSGTNLNPIKPGSGGPSKGIPNHVQGSMEDMGEIFEPGSVKTMISSRLRYNDVDWSKATKAAAKVMAKDGKVDMNIWTYSREEVEALKAAFRSAGFKNVRVDNYGAGDFGPGTMLRASF